MPQMSPMMWTILSMFTFINMFFLMFYLNSLPVSIKIIKKKDNISMFKKKWFWMW